MTRNAKDHALDTLLELHGTVYEIGSGYWVKITAHRVAPDAGRPHGINYSLTLHAPSGERILGYDNAHPVDTTRGPGRKRTRRQDHKHDGPAIRPYGYTDAGALLEDFWADVERILEQRGIT